MQHDFILLDRSSSMSSQWGEALASVNAYVKQLAADNVDTGVTIAVFDRHGNDMDFNVVRDRITPATMRPLSPHEVEPRGSTPLNEATYKLVELANKVHYDRVAIIIMTDGEENSSAIEFTVAGARALLDACRAKGWQVVFLGANFDNVKQAANYGSSIGSTVSASVGNFVGTMRSTASKRAGYGLTGQSISYTEIEQQAAKTKQP